MSLTYVIDPPAIPSLPVTGDIRRFAVNRIFVLGVTMPIMREKWVMILIVNPHSFL